MEKPVINSRKRFKLWPEQKAEAVMQHIPKIFTRSGAMMLHPRIGTRPATKAYLMQPRPRKSDGCDSESACVMKVMPSALNMFARQTLNEDSDIIENAEVKNAARL